MCLHCIFIGCTTTVSKGSNADGETGCFLWSTSGNNFEWSWAPIIQKKDGQPPLTHVVSTNWAYLVCPSPINTCQITWPSGTPWTNMGGRSKMASMPSYNIHWSVWRWVTCTRFYNLMNFVWFPAKIYLVSEHEINTRNAFVMPELWRKGLRKLL